MHAYFPIATRPYRIVSRRITIRSDGWRGANHDVIIMTSEGAQIARSPACPQRSGITPEETV
ncbi:hypothetical protein NX02_24750 [Sphingomonas sanxanigenens DSM 19645 = NX02]|uniref:Uncharacterized protein n=1 Tax=Sphingomonas sanxanigenens DSM 19645 = NX02 TaxID=1123269 RepID=W0AJ39_9SPHN|nr:hypothetical protein NX02_24750 [Sphingomonas sanxanigenens DSM 19645 = NX02]